MRYYAGIFLILFFLWSCSGTGGGRFNQRSAHAAYGNRLEEAGLHQTALGRQWFAAAARALGQPVRITLPYREQGFFPAEDPRAAGLLFDLPAGAKLEVKLEREAADSLLLFAELWEAGPQPRLLETMDTAKDVLSYETDEARSLILRLQPELLGAGAYNLSLTTGPSLQFPVAGPAARVGSIWGDPRDAGARNHEGIDIFAPKGTPAVAAADGYITRVNENRLGGLVVWLRPKGKNYTLYYAHLDRQLVTDGQRVQAGDTVGLVGNTGNARTTPPHLHFGIYASGGA
ncbi:MAG TPA: M23 family metallopeptidase, partial [Chitinophagaceae bacterium]|nr:M23 family metallopeptidase [Chitinophagaceae bacterium]